MRVKSTTIFVMLILSEISMLQVEAHLFIPLNASEKTLSRALWETKLIDLRAVKLWPYFAPLPTKPGPEGEGEENAKSKFGKETEKMRTS